MTNPQATDQPKSETSAALPPTKSRAHLFQPVHDQDALLAAYQLHRGAQAGTDGDFCSRQGISRNTFNRYLRQWRGKAASGLHPVSGKPDEKATDHAIALGLDAEDIDPEGDLEQDSEGDEDLKRNSSSSPLLRAWADKIMLRALKGKKVSPSQMRAASDIRKESTKQGAGEGEGSSYSAWPTAALGELLGVLGVDVLREREDVRPPALASAPEAGRAEG